MAINATDHNAAAATKNIAVFTADKYSPVYKTYKRIAAKWGLFCKLSHGSVWCRPEDEARANKLFSKVAAHHRR